MSLRVWLLFHISCSSILLGISCRKLHVTIRAIYSIQLYSYLSHLSRILLLRVWLSPISWMNIVLAISGPIFSLFASRTFLHFSNSSSTSTLDSAHRGTSSANSNPHGGCVLTSDANTPITIMNSSGLKQTLDVNHLLCLLWCHNIFSLLSERHTAPVFLSFSTTANLSPLVPCRSPFPNQQIYI